MDWLDPHLALIFGSDNCIKCQELVFMLFLKPALSLIFVRKNGGIRGWDEKAATRGHSRCEHYRTTKTAGMESGGLCRTFGDGSRFAFQNRTWPCRSSLSTVGRDR